MPNEEISIAVQGKNAFKYNQKETGKGYVNTNFEGTEEGKRRRRNGLKLIDNINRGEYKINGTDIMQEVLETTVAFSTIPSHIEWLWNDVDINYLVFGL